MIYLLYYLYEFYEEMFLYYINNYLMFKNLLYFLW